MDWTKVQKNFYDLKIVKVLIRPNCRKLPTIWKICIELNCRKIPTIWKMWIELTSRKIPTIWKIRIELNCRKKPTIWKEWKFFCGLGHIVGNFLRFEKSESLYGGLNRIVGKFIQFERCGLNQVVGNSYDLKRVNILIWPNCRQIPTIWKLCIECNRRKIPIIWKMWIQLYCRKIQTIWKQWNFYVDLTKLYEHSYNLKNVDWIKL